MYGLTGTELPFRSRKDFARAQQWRGSTKHHNGPVRTASDDMWMPMMNERRFRQDLMSSRSASFQDRFRDRLGSPLPRSVSTDDTTYNDYYTTESRRRGGFVEASISFENAASALFEALNDAVGYCKALEHDFTEGMCNVQLWAPPGVVNELWMMKIDWNGIPTSILTKSPNSKPIEQYDYYNKHVRRLIKAWEDMRYCGPMSFCASGHAESKISSVEIKMTMKKLEVTLQGIEELMQMVRTDRNRMPALVTNLRHARDALLDIEEVWDSSKEVESEHQRKAGGEDI